MGAMGGNSYHKRATEASLKFELRSASNEIVAEASESEQIVKEVEIVTEIIPNSIFRQSECWGHSH